MAMVLKMEPSLPRQWAGCYLVPRPTISLCAPL